MAKGAPHSEEIKIQWECWCGKIETENYTPAEMRKNARLAAGGPLFTEGEWMVSEENEIVEVVSPAGLICKMLPSDIEEDWDCFRENAQLIASAPNLLAALKKFINPTGHTDACMEIREMGVGECTKSCRAARAAIEKATGSPIVSKI